MGVPIETLRYYDRIGLLVPERERNQRVYDQKTKKKLQEILYLKKMDFELSEIKTILEIDDIVDQKLDNNGEDRLDKQVQHMLSILDDKYEHVLNKEKEIQQAKRHIEELIDKLSSFKGSVNHDAG